jgi:hypothetical protein
MFKVAHVSTIAMFALNMERRGCEVLVEEHELSSVSSLLCDPVFLGILDSRFEEAGFQFTSDDLDPDLFDEVSSSVAIYDTPENA